MKLLRSGWVSGVLVLVAVAVVFFQVYLPYARRARPATSRSVAPQPQPARILSGTSTAQPTSSAPRAVVVESSTSPLAPMDSKYLAGRFPVWLDSPARDPFMFIEENPEPDRPDMPSPIQQWKLRGIWRQTGSRLAAINSGIYKEGDEIEGYTLERIDSDQVWFRGTNRIEHLGFATAGPAKVVPPPPLQQPHSGMHKRTEPIEMPVVRPGQEHTVGPRL